MSAGAPDLPNARALRVVLDAAEGLDASAPDFSARLERAVQERPEARDFGTPLLVQLSRSYAAAAAGFVRPPTSSGTVLAGLYIRRRLIAFAVSLPLIATGVLWAVHANDERVRLENEQSRVRELAEIGLRDAMRRRETLEENVAPLVTELSGDRCDRRLAMRAQEDLKEIHSILRDSAIRIGELRNAPSKPVEAGGNGASLEALDASLKEGERRLEKAQSCLALGQRLAAARRSLEGLRREAGKFGNDSRVESIYQDGLRANESESAPELEADVERLRGHLQDLREQASMPDALEAALNRALQRTELPELRAKAAALHREGAAALPANLSKAREAVASLGQMAARLDEEYTVVITGGKWRFRNNNPSIKTYYVIVEVVDAQGRKLQRSIRNEENGRTERVTAWGERVPFEIYERVRKDKQDNGVIDQKIFAAKLKGVLEEELLFPAEDGGIVPRVGQITKW